MPALPAAHPRRHQVHRDPPGAEAALKRPPRPDAASAVSDFPRCTDAAPRARRYAGAVLREWAVDPAAADDTALIVTEIVTNAVRHGLSGDVHLRIDLCGDALTVRVEDQTPYKELPPAGVAGSEEESGRGLLLVEALAERWGHGPVEDGPGTAVWALIRLVAE